MGYWSFVTDTAHAALARIDAVDPGGKEALSRLEAAVQRLARLPAFAPLFALDLAELAAAAGDVSRAESAVARLAEFATITGCAVHGGMEALASAWVALAQQGSDATGPVRQSIVTFDQLDLPLLQGRAYDVLGRAMAGDDPGEAAAAFQNAVARFESCGATWRRDRALAEIERISP